MAERIITDIEYETGIITRKAADAQKYFTVEEFMEAYTASSADFVGVNYDDRAEFLEANGYKLTRANLINPNLSAKQPPADETADTE